MSLESKIDRLLEGDCQWVKDLHNRTDRLDSRTVAIEVKIGQHDVEFKTVKNDIDKIGSKVRTAETSLQTCQIAHRGQMSAPVNLGVWVTVIAFLVEYKMAVMTILALVGVGIKIVVDAMGHHG